MDQRTRDAKVWSFGPGEIGRVDAGGSSGNSGNKLSTDKEALPSVLGSGYPTKKEAADAEVARQIEEQQKRDLAKVGATVVAALPKTLSMLFEEFIRQHAEEELAPKTVERYRDQVTYVHPELLKMPLAEITPLHLSREWSRMLKCGGHTRRDKTPRPMSAKTVRNIAGVVSSVFGRAMKWGLITRNPVSDSEPPVPKNYGFALTPAQQDLLIKSATNPWCLAMLLEMSAATGAGRGEVLALRWSDIQDGRGIIARSLTQTKHVMEFKGTKSGGQERSVYRREHWSHSRRTVSARTSSASSSVLITGPTLT